MFKNMRRKDRELQLDEVNKIILNGEYGILSTIGLNGFPYGIPVSYVYLDNAVYFHCALEGSKLDNISANNRVSFTIVGSTNILPDKFSTNYESVIIFGTAEEALNTEKTAALVELIKKYSPDYIESGMAYVENSASKTKVIKINIEHMSGKARK